MYTFLFCVFCLFVFQLWDKCCRMCSHTWIAVHYVTSRLCQWTVWMWLNSFVFGFLSQGLFYDDTVITWCIKVMAPRFLRFIYFCIILQERCSWQNPPTPPTLRICLMCSSHFKGKIIFPLLHFQNKPINVIRWCFTKCVFHLFIFKRKAVKASV